MGVLRRTNIKRCLGNGLSAQNITMQSGRSSQPSKFKTQKRKRKTWGHNGKEGINLFNEGE